MFGAFFSPTTWARREILDWAAREAATYGTTVKDVVDSFFSGQPRPGLSHQLDRVYATAGMPPPEVMAAVGAFFDQEEIEPADLLVVLGAYADRLPTSAQAKELVEAVQRLARRARSHERQIKAIQAAHDTRIVEEDAAQSFPDPSRRPVSRGVRARMVQRFGIK